MTNMNGKIFVHNKTGNKYMALNAAIGCDCGFDGLVEKYDAVVIAPIDSDDSNWYIVYQHDLNINFTEVE